MYLLPVCYILSNLLHAHKMKITLLLLALSLALTLATPIQMQRMKRDIRAGVMGGFVPPERAIPLEFKVTKGEYVCGNKICKLTPGVEPPGCNGMCQYPILPPI